MEACANTLNNSKVLSKKEKKPRKKLSNRTREYIAGIAFVSPWIIGFAVFGLFPILYSLFLSLSEVTMTGHGIETVFIGITNFKDALTTDIRMLEELGKFLKEALIMVFVINVFAVLFAVILNGKIKGRGFFRVIFFLPVIVVSGPVMGELLDKGVITMPNIGQFGIVSIIGATFGSSIQEFIVNTFSQLIYMFWFSGVQLIVYLTILQKMDKSMYEAANIDGASVWESFWKITLPGLKPAILINLVYTFILLATFDNNGVIALIKSSMFDQKTGFGFASALAWIYFVVLLVIVGIICLLLYGRFGKREKKYVKGEAYVYNQTRYEAKKGFLYTNPKVKKVKRKILGQNLSDGILAKVFVYTILIVMSFAFLYPFVFMFLKSIQSQKDVLDPTINLLPTGFDISNWKTAFKVLGFWQALGQSIYYSLIPTILQVISTAVVGYGLAKFKFPGKKIVFACIIVSFIIPPQVLMIPTYIMYTKMGLLGNISTFAIPAALAQGLKNSIFILLFYQSFRMLPKELDEAAEVDGASKVRIFFKVALPLSVPIFIVCFLFSFVWYWNETYLTSLYINGAKTLPMQLAAFAESFRKLYEQMGGQAGFVDNLNEAIYMAGTLISIIPLLLMYFVLQKWFVEGIDKTGLTGQ